MKRSSGFSSAFNPAEMSFKPQSFVNSVNMHAFKTIAHVGSAGARITARHPVSRFPSSALPRLARWRASQLGMRFFHAARLQP